jgi:hypothetical protein
MITGHNRLQVIFISLIASFAGNPGCVLKSCLHALHGEGASALIVDPNFATGSVLEPGIFAHLGMEYFNEPEFQDPVDVLEPIVAEANRGQHTKRTIEFAWAFRGPLTQRNRFRIRSQPVLWGLGPEIPSLGGGGPAPPRIGFGNALPPGNGIAYRALRSVSCG